MSQERMDQSVKQCPFCAETIEAPAIVCPYCQRDLSTTAPDDSHAAPVHQGLTVAQCMRRRTIFGWIFFLLYVCGGITMILGETGPSEGFTGALLSAVFFVASIISFTVACAYYVMGKGYPWALGLLGLLPLLTLVIPLPGIPYPLIIAMGLSRFPWKREDDRDLDKPLFMLPFERKQWEESRKQDR